MRAQEEVTLRVSREDIGIYIFFIFYKYFKYCLKFTICSPLLANWWRDIDPRMIKVVKKIDVSITKLLLINLEFN